jgi:Leucine-rich repeat (LRR) protein
MKVDHEDARNVMNVVSKYTTLTELYMDYNNICNLLYILPESFNLASLSLSGCDLGGGVFEGMISVSTEGVSKLLTEYPSLVYLDLNDNEYGDEQGEAIAEALRLNTSLTKLDLRENDIRPTVREQIANAWKPRKAANLLLDEWSDEPDMEDETLLLDDGSDELDMEDE